MKTTPTGLADLALAYEGLTPVRRDMLRIARLVGLAGNIVFEDEELPEPVSIVDEPLLLPSASSPPADPQAMPPQSTVGRSDDATRARAEPPPTPPPPFYQRFNRPGAGPGRSPIGLPIKLTEQKPPAAGDIPPYIADAEELDFEPPTYRRLTLPAQIVPASQLRSLVVDLIAALTTGDVDVSAVVEQIARGRVPRILPLKRRRSVARRIHVLFDTADSMRLFRHDAAAFLLKLGQVGGTSLCSAETTYGAPVESDDRYTSGDTLLLLSDFGIGSREAARESRAAMWLEYAQSQRARGVRISALVPFHYSRWPAGLKQLMRVVHWHPPGSAATPATPKQLRTIARALSLAAIIDPALLRYVRTSLFPSSDVGTEVDFANARWAAFYNSRIVVLRPSWLLALRSDLALDRQLLELSRLLLLEARPRAAGWERVVYEEQIVYLGLHQDDESSDQLKHALARVIRSLLGRLSNDTASARWALCLVAELPEAARRTEAAQLLKAIASRMLNTSFDEVRKIVRNYDAKWVFGPMTEAGVLWDGTHLIIREPPQVTDQVMPVPATRPRVVIVEDSRRRVKSILRFVRSGAPSWAPMRLPQTLSTAVGAEYRAESLPGMWQRLVHAFERQESMPAVATAMITGYGFRVDIGVPALLPEFEILLELPEQKNMIGWTAPVRIAAIEKPSRKIFVTLAERRHDVISETAWSRFVETNDSFEQVSLPVVTTGRTACIVNAFGSLVAVPYSDFPLALKKQAQNGQLVGREVPFYVAKIHRDLRQVTLTPNLRPFKLWKSLLQTKETKRTLRGTIAKRVPGGFLVDIGMRPLPPAFVSDGAISDVTIEPSRLVGVNCLFHVAELNWEAEQKIVLTRNDLVHEERALEGSAAIIEGELYRGTVSQVLPFGAAVIVQKATGYLANNKISGPIKNAAALLNQGDVIDVKVIRFDRTKSAWQSKLRFAYDPPETAPAVAEQNARWNKLVRSYPVGTVFWGKVTKVVDFGAFVRIAGDVIGLVHRSQISERRIRDARTAIEVDQIVRVRVVQIDDERRRFALTMRDVH